VRRWMPNYAGNGKHKPAGLVMALDLRIEPGCGKSVECLQIVGRSGLSAPIEVGGE